MVRPGVERKTKIRVNGTEVEIDDPGKYLERSAREVAAHGADAQGILMARKKKRSAEAAVRDLLIRFDDVSAAKAW